MAYGSLSKILAKFATLCHDTTLEYNTNILKYWRIAGIAVKNTNIFLSFWDTLCAASKETQLKFQQKS